MLFKTRSAAVYGIEAYLVDVEVNISTGGNGEFYIVGLPDTAVRESRSRVIAAIRNNGFGSPYQRITVNLAPADMKKEGSAFDLPMAVGILGGHGLLARSGSLRLPDGRRTFARWKAAARSRRPVDRDAGERSKDSAPARPVRQCARSRGRRRRLGLSDANADRGRRLRQRHAHRSKPLRVERQHTRSKTRSAAPKTFAMFAASITPNAPSKWPWRAGTTCCWSGRRERARRCWPNAFRPSCRR